MLDTHCGTLILATFGVLQCKGSRKDWILAEIFIGTSTHRQALDVDSRAKDHVLSTKPCLLSHSGSILVSKLLAPCGSKGRSGREICSRIQLPTGGLESIGNSFLADAERTVCIMHVGNAETFHSG